MRLVERVRVIMGDWAKEEEALLKALGGTIGREKLIRLLPPSLDESLAQLEAANVSGIKARLASLRVAIQAEHEEASRLRARGRDTEDSLPDTSEG